MLAIVQNGLEVVKNLSKKLEDGVAMLAIVQNGLEASILTQQMAVTRSRNAGYSAEWIRSFVTWSPQGAKAVAMLAIVQNGLEEPLRILTSSSLEVAMLAIVQNGLEGWLMERFLSKSPSRNAGYSAEGIRSCLTKMWENN